MSFQLVIIIITTVDGSRISLTKKKCISKNFSTFPN